MFWNNVKIALRNLRKNKLFAAINISGLAIGLTIYVFGGLLINYESTHDLFFENTPRIYTIGSTAAPGLNVGVDKMNSTFTAVAPIIQPLHTIPIYALLEPENLHKFPPSFR